MKINKTKIANASDKPLIPADKDKFWSKILEPWVYWLIESNFSSVRIKNTENYKLANPNYANILYGPHCCFHDGQVAYYICRKAFGANFYIMIQDLYKLPILSKIGGFSVEKTSPVESLKSINYAANLLKNKENMLWIFPQGRVVPPDCRPIKFESGLTYISSKVRGVNLIPIAIKYTFLKNDKPEIFVDVGEPIIIENGISNRKEFTRFLEEDLTGISDAQIKKISQGDLDGYEFLYKNKEPLSRRLEPYLKNIVFDKRYLKASLKTPK